MTRIWSRHLDLPAVAARAVSTMRVFQGCETRQRETREPDAQVEEEQVSMIAYTPHRHVMLLIAVPALLLAASVAAEDKIVISHRGASGYLPEHTLEAYAMAYAQGADYIEQDLALTKDGHFVCVHDIQLDSTTNVEEVYPDRKRPDGRWYAADFTLEEIKGLRVHERLPNRFPVNASKFEVPTFEEAIELIQGLNKTCGRNVGIYPELKKPFWHAQAGLPMEEAFLKVVGRYGYAGRDAAIFVQCFEPPTLKRLRLELKSELPQIQLTGEKNLADPAKAGAALDQIAAYAEGIGPDKELIETTPDIVKWAHERHLEVHPYTLRADDVPPKYARFDDELAQFYAVYGVDGLFTDFPDKAVQYLSQPTRQ